MQKDKTRKVKMPEINFVRCSGKYEKRKLKDWTQHTVQNLEHNMFLAHKIIVNDGDECSSKVDKKYLALYHREAGEIALYFKYTKKNKERFLKECWSKIELLFEKINDNIVNDTDISDFMFRNLYKLRTTYKYQYDIEIDLHKLANIEEIK
jgi:hypothetical protein